MIMGIVNITPDSFYDGGRFESPKKALEQAYRLIEEGADILDFGAESTRPGAKMIREADELTRLMPVLEELCGKVSVSISVDTSKAKVAKAALECGADIINDVSSFRQEPELANVVAHYRAGIVLMHRRGTPGTMQQMTNYDDLMKEITEELSERMRFAEQNGIDAEQMVLDPGIGFAKTPAQNFEMIRRLSELHELERPVLVGPSRKSFIGSVTGKGPEDRLPGTIAACVMSVLNGGQILRVHDVREVREAILVSQLMVQSNSNREVRV